jgi:hypothetical protein
MSSITSSTDHENKRVKTILCENDMDAFKPFIQSLTFKQIEGYRNMMEYLQTETDNVVNSLPVLFKDWMDTLDITTTTATTQNQAPVLELHAWMSILKTFDDAMDQQHELLQKNTTSNVVDVNYDENA